MLRALVITACVGALHAAIIDRIAITVGRDVITELQLDEEIRITAFLNRQPIVRNAQARRAAAARLVEQLLVKREMELSHYPLPEQDDVEKYEDQIRAEYGSAERLSEALASYDLSATAFKDHLALQLMTLRFIEFRFRPEGGVSAPDIEARTDQVLNAWLEQSRKQVNIVYRDKTLQ